MKEHEVQLWLLSGSLSSQTSPEVNVINLFFCDTDKKDMTSKSDNNYQPSLIFLIEGGAYSSVLYRYSPAASTIKLFTAMIYGF